MKPLQQITLQSAVFVGETLHTRKISKVFPECSISNQVLNSWQQVWRHTCWTTHTEQNRLDTRANVNQS